MVRPVGDGSSGSTGPAPGAPAPSSHSATPAPAPAGGAADSAIPFELLEKLRRSGFRIDSEGQFQHEGEPVRHEGLRRALFRWLDSLPDGRIILRLDGDRFAYLDVDDTPLVARAARVVDSTILLALSDGNEEPLLPASLSVDEHGVMRCRVREGRLPARLSTSAAAILGQHVQERAGGLVFILDGNETPLAPRSAAPR